MIRKAISLSTILLGAVLLSSCGSLTFTEQDLQFQLTPSHTLGYEVSDTGAITIVERSMEFRNSAGEMGATITGFEVTYFDSTGAAVTTGNAAGDGSFALNVYVPPGYTCDEPDEVYGCDIFDAGWRAAPGPVVPSSAAGNLLPGEIAQMHLEDDMIGPPGSSVKWTAEFVFHGFRSDGTTFVTDAYEVPIFPPN